jgi:4-hydroxy-tetrahydrodipicolinate reductase
MEKIRAIVIGVGKSAVAIHRLMVEKGVGIVGAIDLDPNKVGKDLGDVIELGRQLNVTIRDDAEGVLSENEADIAFVCALSTMELMYETYVACIKNGMNVISMANTEIYPWTVYPELTAKLDKLAKEHNVTVTGSGNQDILGVNLPILMTGCCASIKSITGRATNDLNKLGEQVCRDLHVGQSLEEFKTTVIEKDDSVLYYRTWLESIAAKLNLTVTKIEYVGEPVVYDEDVACKPLGMIVKKGTVAGLTMRSVVETDQGVTLVGEYIGKIYKEGEVGVREWTIKGIPDLHIDYSAPGVPGVTRGTQLVNRIPDVINMEPGFKTIENFPMMYLRHYPLHTYLRK